MSCLLRHGGKGDAVGRDVVPQAPGRLVDAGLSWMERCAAAQASCAQGQAGGGDALAGQRGEHEPEAAGLRRLTF